MDFEYRQKTVYYSVLGQGPDVVFLHGWGCDSTIFAPFAAPLSSSHRVFCVDLPGFGGSDEPDQVWGTFDYADMLDAFCRHAGIDKPVLIGHSFGGRVSIAYASQHEAGKLILVDSAGVKPHRSAEYYIKVWSYKAVKFFLLKILRREDLLEKYRSRAGSADYNSASPKMKAVLSKAVNEDLCPVMPSIMAPTLLFWGTEDTATPISDARKMNRLIPDSGIVPVEGAGHYSFLQNPALFLKVTETFLNQ